MTGARRAVGVSSGTNFIGTIEKQQGLKIACLEEIAFTRGLIDRPRFEALIDADPNPANREYLASLLL